MKRSIWSLVFVGLLPLVANAGKGTAIGIGASEFKPLELAVMEFQVVSDLFPDAASATSNNRKMVAQLSGYLEKYTQQDKLGEISIAESTPRSNVERHADRETRGKGPLSMTNTTLYMTISKTEDCSMQVAEILDWIATTFPENSNSNFLVSSRTSVRMKSINYNISDDTRALMRKEAKKRAIRDAKCQIKKNADSKLKVTKVKIKDENLQIVSSGIPLGSFGTAQLAVKVKVTCDNVEWSSDEE